MTEQRRIHEKPVVYRRAVAVGRIRLAPSTRAAVRARRVAKGDPIAVGEVAGLMAMRRTSELIPHCHAVALTGSAVVVRPARGGLVAEATAETLGRTGVEMEALVGVTVALLTVWDMVKYLEKDESGRYPNVRVEDVRVVAKTRRPVPGAA